MKAKKIISMITVSMLLMSMIPFGMSAMAKGTKPVVTKSIKWDNIDEGTLDVTVGVKGMDQNVVEKTDIVLALDHSSSMNKSIFGSNNPIGDAKKAINNFITSIQGDKSLSGNVRVGFVSYQKAQKDTHNLTTDYDSVKRTVSNMSEFGLANGTNIQAGIKGAENMLSSSTADKKIIIVIGDGEPTYSYEISGGTFNGIHTRDKTNILGKIKGIKASYDSFTFTSCDYNSIIGVGTRFDIWAIDKLIHHNTVEKTVEATASNGKNYKDTISYSPENHGEATIFEANQARAKGIEMFSVGFGVTDSDKDAIDTLKGIADSGNYFKAEKKDYEALDTALASIKNQTCYTVPQGTESVLTDGFSKVKIGSGTYDCEIVGDVTASSGTVTKNADNIYWNIGNVPSEEAIMTYKLKIKSQLPAGENTVVANPAELNYKDVDGKQDLTENGEDAKVEYRKYNVKFTSFEENGQGNLVKKVLLDTQVLNGESIAVPETVSTKGYNVEWPADIGNEITVNGSDINIEAVTSPKKFNVRFFDFDGVQIGSAQSIEYRNSAVAPDAPASADKNFEGWSVDYSSITADTDVYPKGVTKEFTVNFTVIDEETGANIELPSQTVKYGNKAQIPSYDIPDGYEMVNAFDVSEPVTMDKTVTAQIALKKYNVTFNVLNTEDNTSADLGSVTVKHGKTVDMADVPAITVPEGYEVTDGFDATQAITDNTTITAKMAKKEFSVIFQGTDGNTLSEIKVKYGDSVKAPSAPAKDGFAFAGWEFVNSNNTTTLNKVVSDVTLRTVYQEVIDINDDDIAQGDSSTDNSSVDIPDEKIPQSSNPKTDAHSAMPYIAVIGALVCVAVIYTGKKLKVHDR